MHPEGFAVESYAFLGIEDGTRGGGADDDGCDEVDGREDNHGEECDDYVGDTFDGVLPFGHEAVVDDNKGRVEDGVLFDGTDDEVAGVGGDLDDKVGRGVEVAQDVVDEVLLVVLDGDDDFLDMVLLDEVAQVVKGAERGHDVFKWRVESGEWRVVDVDVADEEVARVGLLVFDVEVGVEGFGAGTYEEGGEAELAGVHAAHGLRGDDEAEEVGEGEVDDEEEKERKVMVAVGGDAVVSLRRALRSTLR